MEKHTDLQPWLDYFEMLRTYIDKGFLEVMPDKHEAYITLPAILTLAGTDVQEHLQTAKALSEVTLNIRAYAAFRSQEGIAYLKKDFAIHVVESEQPHDLIYTLLLTQSRRWIKLCRKTDSIEVISYMKKEKRV